MRRIFSAWVLAAGALVAGSVAFCQQPEILPASPATSSQSLNGLPPNPPELREFEGLLYGEVLALRNDRAFTGLLVRLEVAQPLRGERTDLRKIAGTVVPVAIPLNASGKPQPTELGRAFKNLFPHETIWADVRAAAPSGLLYARHLGPTGPPAARRAPVPAARDSSPDQTTLRGMEAELRDLRRGLARLQQDVAELKLRTEDLQRRAPAHR